MPLFQIPLINCNKAFKAGPARAAVFQVTGALDSKAHRSGRGVGGGGGRCSEDVFRPVIMILAVTRMLRLADFLKSRTNYPLFENQPEIPIALFRLPSMPNIAGGIVWDFCYDVQS